MTTSASQVMQENDQFLITALRRNRAMPTKAITAAAQVIDIELEQVPGWAHRLVLPVFADLAVTIAAGGTVPSFSQWFPWNLFSDVEVSLGGGPFQRVSPVFYFLRKKAMNPGWQPGFPGPQTYAYTQSAAWNVPQTVSGTAGSTTDNYVQYTMEIPLQTQHGSIMGHIPLGDAKITCKIRLTVAPNLYSATDQWASPIVGGTDVSVAIGTTKPSFVGMDIRYRTTPATGAQLPTPTVGQILNVQQLQTQFVGAAAETPIYFKDPFTYLRLWHIVQDGTGAMNSLGIQNFELDLTPGYSQYQFNTPAALQSYFEEVAHLYRGDMPTGVFVFDLWSGSDPSNPNGEQMIDGSLFQTLQTRLMAAATMNVASPAKIITFAEALSPVDF